MNIYHDADGTQESQTPLLGDYADSTVDIESADSALRYQPQHVQNNGKLRNGDVIRNSNQHVFSNGVTPIVDQHLERNLFVSNLQQEIKSGLESQNEHKPLHIPSQHNLVSQRPKKSPSGLLTRLARKKLKRKKFFYAACDQSSGYCAACELDRNYCEDKQSSGQHCAVSADDFNYEYIACDRCGGYKVS